MKIKFFTNLIKRHNKNTTLNLVSGFTIVEALVAIFILTVSVSSMLGVTASSSSYSRYSNNEITANYLIQEAIDSIRNSRDTIAFQQKGEDEEPGTAWKAFLNRYGYNGVETPDKCFSAKGCYLKMEEFDATNTTENGTGVDIKLCNDDTNTTGCPFLKYNDELDANTKAKAKVFYNYSGSNESIFNRKVNMVVTLDNPDEVKVTAVIEWSNGNGITKMNSKTLEIYLLNWQN